MSKTRTLTIASMAAPGWVRINEVANTDGHAEIICGGKISVNRSLNGKVYAWDTDTDHIRIVVRMTGATDLPFITYQSRGAGWFQLEDFPQVILGSNNLVLGGADSFDPNEIERASASDLGSTAQAAAH